MKCQSVFSLNVITFCLRIFHTQAKKSTDCFLPAACERLMNQKNAKKGEKKTVQ